MLIIFSSISALESFKLEQPTPSCCSADIESDRLWSTWRHCKLSDATSASSIWISMATTKVTISSGAAWKELFSSNAKSLRSNRQPLDLLVRKPPRDSHSSLVALDAISKSTTSTNSPPREEWETWKTAVFGLKSLQSEPSSSSNSEGIVDSVLRRASVIFFEGPSKSNRAQRSRVFLYSSPCILIFHIRMAFPSRTTFLCDRNPRHPVTAASPTSIVGFAFVSEISSDSMYELQLCANKDTSLSMKLT